MTIEINVSHTAEAITKLLKGITEYLNNTKHTQRFDLYLKLNLHQKDC